MKNLALILLAGFVSASCTSTFSGKKTAHEQYGEKLEDKGLDNSPEGRLWRAASLKALQQPVSVKLPYRMQGYFHSDKPRALGLQFQAKRGEQLIFTFIRKNETDLVLFADLFRQAGTDPSLSMEPGTREFHFDVPETGSYTLRLQPELFRSGAYTLSISVGPSLGFPVSGNKARVGSYWGDNRDGGRRSHEGIDIFAPRLTPVTAAEDGIITGVKEGGLGGKTVWQRTGKNIFLYYAHLHKQMVQEGQYVKKGQVLGQVGNTGNARHTPAHLHFGVYTLEGPVDPFPFVNTSVRTAGIQPTRDLSSYLRLTKVHQAQGSRLPVSTLLVPLGAGPDSYIAETPDGTLTEPPFSSAQSSKKPVTGSPNYAARPAADSKRS